MTMTTTTTTRTSWRTEHRDAGVPLWLEHHRDAVDVSWKHDACPCFLIDPAKSSPAAGGRWARRGDQLGGWRLWVEYVYADQRETGGPRFVFALYDADGQWIEDGKRTGSELEARAELDKLADQWRAMSSPATRWDVLRHLLDAEDGTERSICAESMLWDWTRAHLTAAEIESAADYSGRATLGERVALCCQLLAVKSELPAVR